MSEENEHLYDLLESEIYKALNNKGIKLSGYQPIKQGD